MAGGSAERNQLGSRAAQDRARVRWSSPRADPGRPAPTQGSRAADTRAARPTHGLVWRVFQVDAGSLPRHLHRGVAISRGLRDERVGVPERARHSRGGRALDRSGNVGVPRAVATRSRDVRGVLGSRAGGLAGAAASGLRVAGARPTDYMGVYDPVSRWARAAGLRV